MPLLLGAFTILASSVRDRPTRGLRNGVDVSEPRSGSSLKNAAYYFPAIDI